MRFPRQIQDLSEQSTCGQRETLASPTFSPEEEGKHRLAHRSLLWRLIACEAGPYFTHVSRLTICEIDKVVIPAQRGNLGVGNFHASRAVVVNPGRGLGHFCCHNLGVLLASSGWRMLLNILQRTEQPPLHQQRIVRTQMSVVRRLRDSVLNQEEA